MKVAENSEEDQEGSWEEISNNSDVDEEHIGDIIQADPSGVMIQRLKKEANDFLNKSEVK